MSKPPKLPNVFHAGFAGFSVEVRYSDNTDPEVARLELQTAISCLCDGVYRNGTPFEYRGQSGRIGARKQLREQALAKLTPEERKALNV